jgi:hypothetical protein
VSKRIKNSKWVKANPTQLRGGTPWPELRPNQAVSLVDGAGARLAGKVDAITEDRSTFWIYLDDGMGRQLIHSLDGYQLESVTEK